MAGLRMIPEHHQGTGQERYTSRHLSDYAGSKIAVACEKCGRVDNDWNERCTFDYNMSISHQPLRDVRLK
jgi:hypothetical protein